MRDTEAKTPGAVFEKLQNMAITHAVTFPGDRARMYQRTGDSKYLSNERDKPGKLLECLTDNERKLLSELTVEELNKYNLRSDWMPVWP